MLAPVNRSQSPISTASAKPVSVEMPRRHSRRHATGVNSLSPASAVTFSSSRACRAGWRGAPNRTCGQHNRLVGIVERRLRRRRVEALPAQPPVMQLGPRLSTGIDDPVPQQPFRQPMPCPHQIRPGRLPARGSDHARLPRPGSVPAPTRSHPDAANEPDEARPARRFSPDHRPDAAASPVCPSIAAATTDRACTSSPTLVRSENTGASSHLSERPSTETRSVTHEIA